ncbi:hypothetical protein ACIF80_24960 [Streptomyces sp. NPDC085927]|uniref:hypothetical protein n=1 Tax=Streptomyces sp. NPDC085927 TaxID=3365738 RepID=UPI0037D927E9
MRLSKGHFHAPDVGHTLPAPDGRKSGGLHGPPSASTDGFRHGKGDTAAGLPDVRQGAVPVGAVGFPAVAFPAGPFGLVFPLLVPAIGVVTAVIGVLTVTPRAQLLITDISSSKSASDQHQSLDDRFQGVVVVTVKRSALLIL